MKHQYLGKNLPYIDSVMPLLPPASVSYGNESKGGSSNIVTINTLLNGNLTTSGEKVYILDSWLGKDVSLTLDDPSFLNGLQLHDCTASLELPGGCVWQQFAGANHDLVTCYGWKDSVTQLHEESRATIFNTDWSVFFAHSGIVKEDLWKDPSEDQNILSAKLFIPDLPVAKQISILAALVRAVCNDEQEEWKSKVDNWRNCSRVSLNEVMFKCDVKKVIRTKEVIFLECFKQFLVRTADDLGGMSLIPLFQYFVTSKKAFLFVMGLIHISPNFEGEFRVFMRAGRSSMIEVHGHELHFVLAVTELNSLWQVRARGHVTMN